MSERERTCSGVVKGCDGESALASALASAVVLNGEFDDERARGLLGVAAATSPIVSTRQAPAQWSECGGGPGWFEGVEAGDMVDGTRIEKT